MQYGTVQIEFGNDRAEMADAPGPLRFSVSNSVLHFQAKGGHDEGVPSASRIRTLRVDLRDGSMSISLALPLPPDSPVVLGILGILKLHGGSVIALVSKAKQVGTWGPAA